MVTTLDLRIHESQFPNQTIADLSLSLRQGRLAHKFLYTHPRQSRKWLEIHEKFSPARRDSDCRSIYNTAFAQVAEHWTGARLDVLSLGCGGGQKDAVLCGNLLDRQCRPSYWPVDVSPDLVIASWLRVSRGESDAGTWRTNGALGLVADLASDLNPVPAITGLAGRENPRLIAFFGMMPNFEPNQVLSRLATMVRPGDELLVSANLAPGNDYGKGVARVLPLYENTPTNEWLAIILEDLGLDKRAGRLQWAVRSCPMGSGLLRLQADYKFERAQTLRVENQSFDFQAGDCLQLFYSYRHTPEQMRVLLAEYGLTMAGSWITASGEEGVFLFQRG